MVYFPRVVQEVKFLVLEFPVMALRAGRLREQFIYLHFRYKMAVVQEGTDPLLLCDLGGIHVPTGRLIRHRKAVRCNKNTQMRWMRRDVVIAASCLEATLILI